MRAPSWNDLLHLPESLAARRYLDGRNLQVVRLLAAVTTVGAVVPLIILLTESMWAGAAAMGGVLVSNLVLLLLRERPIFHRHVSLFLFSYAVLLVLALAFTAPEPMAVWSVVTFILGTGFLVALRWRESLLWTLAAVFMATAAWSTQPDGATNEVLPLLIVAAVWLGAMALIGRRITRQQLVGFRTEFRRQSSLERERTRMRDELDDARTVQLSMLPQSAPELPWLDVASVSVPATEVGGDYYDYFVLDDDRVAVVVGDVSGHGMSSGLVLAAVRAGLHLLREGLDRPVEALNRLDSMLRATTPGRMFVSLQLALIDRSRREIRVANAGHPPALFLTEHGTEALGAPGKPLGTRLEGDFGEQRVAFQPGDVLVFYTDGVTELRNFRDQPFGFDRVEREASRQRSERSAKAIRDRLLSSLTHFRTDVEQADDVTLVVVALEPGS